MPIEKALKIDDMKHPGHSEDPDAKSTHIRTSITRNPTYNSSNCIEALGILWLHGNQISHPKQNHPTRRGMASPNNYSRCPIE